MTAVDETVADDDVDPAYLVGSLTRLARPSSIPRPFHERDLPHLGTLVRLVTAEDPEAANRDALSWASLLEGEREPDRNPILDGWLVIDDDLGAAAFVTVQLRDGRPFIPHLITRPDAQARGHAAVLLGEVAHRMLTAGHSEIALMAVRSNPAFEFYRNLGFTEVE